MILEDADYYVRTIKMPIGIHGCVSEDADGFFSVYINELDPVDRQKKALDHERRHIEGNDFSKNDIIEIEGL